MWEYRTFQTQRPAKQKYAQDQHTIQILCGYVVLRLPRTWLQVTEAQPELAWAKVKKN